jgi:hypothetical protein
MQLPISSSSGHDGPPDCRRTRAEQTPLRARAIRKRGTETKKPNNDPTVNARQKQPRPQSHWRGDGVLASTAGQISQQTKRIL